MKPFFKAALLGATLAAAVFFFHFLIPALLLLLFFGLIPRALFGPRWRHAAYVGYPNHGNHAFGSQRTPTVDGRDWQRPASANTQGRDVQVN
jgi:hypothetical protein